MSGFATAYSDSSMDPYIQSSTHGVVVGNTQVSPSFPDLNRRYQPRERWIQHYSSSHKILLVGEGDFSFSASLAMAFDSATNMVATSLDPREFLFKNYKYSEFNISNLRSRGCTVMHEIDATEMEYHYLLKGMTFDRIIFNFPLAGFFPGESRIFKISQNQTLILLFLDNAKKMISEEGEIHITHKSWGFFRQWNLEDLAVIVGLKLIEELPFNVQNYRGYNTKYGFGSDKNFNCNPSRTYIFGHKQQPPQQLEEFLAQHKKATTAAVAENWRQQVKKVFQEGDLVMVYLPVGLRNNFKKKKFGPYQVIKKMGIDDNAHVIYLLEEDIAISPTFHVEDVFEYDPSSDESIYPEPNFRGTYVEEVKDQHKSTGAPVSLNYTT